MPNDGSNLHPLTSDSNNEKRSAHILAKLVLDYEANQERSIGSGDRKKEKMKDKYKMVNDLRLSELTSNDIKLNLGSSDVAVELSKDNNHESDEHRKLNESKKISKRHNMSEKHAPPVKFCEEGRSCSENRDIDVGFKESSKYKNKQKKKERKKGMQKGITDFDSLKNPPTERGSNLEDEIFHGDLMGREKDQKKQRKRKADYKESENSMRNEKDQKKQRKRKADYKESESSTSTDNCNWDNDKELDKKGKMKDYFLESELVEGCSKKKANKKVVPGGDADEVPSKTHISNKEKKREKEKDDISNCPEFTLKIPSRKENGDQGNTAATTNNAEKNKSDMMTLNFGKGSSIAESYNFELKNDAKKGKKKVRFSNKVEEFPLTQPVHEELGPDNLVWGKRYTPEEDELIRKATMNYIEVNKLGEQGLHMILNCRSYRREVKDCWKVITSALPWRPRFNTYLRAHGLFEKSEERKWEPEEFEVIRRYYAEHGPKWKKLGEVLGKSRVQVKDAWRRIRLPNKKLGKWSQVEYQSLFDLVNLDLQLKAFEERKNNHAMLKDNISWQAISNKMSTRAADACCLKWYNQLSSSIVQEGNWSNLDDYKLIDALQDEDPFCFEDVDWDTLLEHRSGEICQKRWHEMIRHLDKFWAMQFGEQLEVLSQRYRPDMITYKQNKESINPVLV